MAIGSKFTRIQKFAICNMRLSLGFSRLSLNGAKYSLALRDLRLSLRSIGLRF